MKRFFLILFVLFGLSTEASVPQINIAKVEQMPNMPSPYQMRDWQQVAREYDAFVFDFSKSGQYLPLIWWDTSQVNLAIDVFGLPSYVGSFFQTGGTAHEAINCMGAVLGATLAGIDKSNQNGYNWVLMLENYFSLVNGENLYLNNLWGDTGQSFWYEILPSVLFYQLNYYYPDTGNFNNEFIITADRWYDACVAMGGKTSPWTVPNFNHTAFDFDTMTPYDNGIWLEPDASAAIGWIEYIAYVKSGNQKYLDAADWSMQFIQNQTQSPLYDVLLCFAPYIATRMNAEMGRSYDVDKFLNFCFNGNQHGWGIQAYNWGGYDVGGLVSSSIYAFEMESLVFAEVLVPLVRYDQRYARAIGKYMLNLANSNRLFYPNAHDAAHQTSWGWTMTYDPNACIGYEGLKKERVDYNRTSADYQTKSGNRIAGTHKKTHRRDNDYEVFQEGYVIGGKDSLEHIWTIPLTDGYFHQVLVRGHMENMGGSEAGFEFYWSQNPAGPWIGPLFCISSTTNEDKWFDISSAAGTIYLRVKDKTNYDNGGNPGFLDKLYVDEIWVETKNSTITPYASGDPQSFGWGDTDLGLYGSSYVGILGGVVKVTNIEKILQIDLIKTDYYGGAAYPTYLYYNPYAVPQTVSLDVGTVPVDVYDTVSQGMLKVNVRGAVDITIPADSAVVAVLAPAGGWVTIEGNKKKINDIVVDYMTNTIFLSCAQVQASPERLAADISGDCVVDIIDIAELTLQWLQHGDSTGRADVNHDGVVNLADISMISNQWLL